MKRRDAIGALAGLALVGCAEEDVFVAPQIERPEPESIDADPLALLPGEPVMASYVDAAALFKTPLAPGAAEFVASFMPLGAESNFVAARDVARVWSGVYALSGVDLCSVITGAFDEGAIRRAADGNAIAATGAPLVRSRYAGTDLFTSKNVGFAIVTSRTALAGSETGMRRALDRLRRPKLTRDVPAWMTDLAKTPNVDLALAGDFTDQPAVAAAARQLAFLSGLERVRLIGNFRAPSVNLAAALSYPARPNADAGAAALRGANGAAWFAALVLGGAPPNIQVAQAENDVGLVATVDEGFARGLLRAAAVFARGA